MAYRIAEQTRWRQFDFVVGYEIKQSQTHPCEDICDTLAGKYPKSFVWTGWHPMDKCYCVAILKSDDEFWRDLGENNPGKSEKEVTDVPQGFKDWVKDNRERIENAEKRGTQPYFIRDNQKRIEEILNHSINNKPSADYASHTLGKSGSKAVTGKIEKGGIGGIGNPLTEEQKLKRDRIKEQMIMQDKREYSSKLFSTPLSLPNKSIREWVNQPHYDFDAKNDMLLNLQQALDSCDKKIRIPVKPKHAESVSDAFALPINIGNKQSYIIIHEMRWGEIKIYGISDNDSIIQK